MVMVFDIAWAAFGAWDWFLVAYAYDFGDDGVLGFRYPGAAVDGWLFIVTTEKKWRC
jgi:hypothetical protein